MAQLTALLSSVTRQMENLRSDCNKLLTGTDTSNGMQGQISASLGNLKRTLDEVESLAKREITTVKREKALQKSAEVREEYNAMKRQYDQWKQKHREEQEKKERSALLGAPTPQQDPSGVPIGDYYISEGDALRRTEQHIDDYITMGKNALQELYDQKSILKTTQRRLLDIANALGLSNTVIRYIETRGKQDKWILYGGIFFCLVFLYYMLKWFR